MKGYKMDLEQVNNTYGKIIWVIAEKYETEIWTASDIYNEILILLFIAIRDGKISTELSFASEKIVRSFAICRAIDIMRKETHRKGSNYPQNDYEECPVEEEIEAPLTGFEYEFEKSLIWEMLVAHMPLYHALAIFELAFPSEKTIDIAMKDVSCNCIENLRVNPKHVQKFLAPDYKISLGYFSKIRARARQVYEETTGVKLKRKTRYRTCGRL